MTTTTDALWTMSLEGCDDSTGDNGYGPLWAGLLVFTPDTDWNDPMFDPLSDTELGHLVRQEGAIVWQDSNGNVGHELHHTTESLGEAWELLQANLATC